MKYIKKYESIDWSNNFTTDKYDVGDYVILTKYIMEYFDIETSDKKIIRKSIDFYYLDGIERLPISDNDIVRKMTPEEIKQYELNKMTNKYNL